MSVDTDTGAVVPNLNNSRPLDVWKVSYSQELKDAMEIVYEVVADENGNRRNKTKGYYRKTVRAIVIDCYVAYQQDKSKYIGIPCSAEAYAPETRMHQLHFRQKVVKRAIDALEDNGLIRRHKGYFNREDGSGRLTRIIATEKLVELLEGHRVVPDMIEQSDLQPVIILKDENKHEIAYRKTQSIRQMESNIRLINTAMRKNCINLCLSDAGHERLKIKLRTEKYDCDILPEEYQYQVLDEKKIGLYRVFNNSSFEQGGRFYGSWYQSIPSDYRRLIHINGDETVELDYSGLHPTMLYCIAGITEIPEPYLLSGMDISYRKTVKPILNIMLNAKSKLSAIKAVRDKIELQTLPEPFCNPEYLVEQYLIKHSGIRGYMNNNWGVKLQYQDSVMAEEIMLSLLQEGILALPVHDSFIVTKKHGERLKQKMVEVFQKKYGYVIGIKSSEDKPSKFDPDPELPNQDNYRRYYGLLNQYYADPSHWNME